MYKKDKILLKGLKLKMKKYNFNDNFDKNLLLALEKLKKISYDDYIIDLLFTYKNIVFLHRLLEYVNQIVIFSIEPFFIDNRFTIYYKKFYSIYIENIFLIKKVYGYDFIGEKKVLFSKNVNFLIRNNKDNNKGELLLEFGIVKTPKIGALFDNYDDIESGFFINFIYGRNMQELIYNNTNGNHSESIGFYIANKEILIGEIGKKKGFFIPFHLKISVTKFFLLFLSKLKKEIIGLGNNLAFSRNEKGFGGIYDDIYKKYGFEKKGDIYYFNNLKKYFLEKKIHINGKKGELINKLFDSLDYRFK